ncbi:hypothetical protein H1235_07950 [Pseudoxanthomonas sp. NC8]|nr:hypothetical protein H1235_07950 [Pseudoxanthomonas sp. NC8]
MEAHERYTRIGQLLQNVPVARDREPLGAEDRQWMAKGLVLVEDGGNILDVGNYRAAMGNAPAWPHRSAAFAAMALALETCLARAELQLLPAALQGAFIQAGNTLDAFHAVGRVLGEVRQEVLVVDPYLDHTFCVITPRWRRKAFPCACCAIPHA